MAAKYIIAFGSYLAFPPLNDDPSIWTDPSIVIKPITVAVGTLVVSIDTIEPGDSEFSVTTQNLIYYTRYVLKEGRKGKERSLLCCNFSRTLTRICWHFCLHW